MCGDGAAIGFLCGDVIHRIFHHSPSALGRYHLNRAAIVRGLVDYVAMALSPHFGLFILNCFIVYLPLVFYDVLECLLPYCQGFCAPVCFYFFRQMTFQARICNCFVDFIVILTGLYFQQTVYQFVTVFIHIVTVLVYLRGSS